MSTRKINNKGVYIENSNVSGGESYIAGHDINQLNRNTGITPEQFQELLAQITSELQKSSIKKEDIEDIKSNISLALKQSQKEKPQQSLILGPLTTALNLLIQTGSAATGISKIAEMIQQAMTFTKSLF